MAAGVIAQLRALAWMRWRLFANGPKGGTKRDTFERFSRAVEYLFPMAALALFVPLALLSAGSGGATGYLLARGEHDVAGLVAVRWMGLVLLSVVAAMLVFRATFAEPSHAPRLRLLPLEPAVPAIDELVRSLGNPWLALALPALLAVPIGFAVAGKTGGAVVLLLASLSLALGLAAAISLGRMLLAAICRSPGRRRLVSVGAMVAIVVVPMALIVGDLPEAGTDGAPAPSRSAFDLGPGGVLQVPGWLRLLPTEPWVVAVEATVKGRPAKALAATAIQGGLAALLATAAALLSGRLAGETSRGRGRRRTGAIAWKRLPILSVGTETVARATFLSLIRSGPGRMQLAIVPATFLCLALMQTRAVFHPKGAFALDGATAGAAGLGIALFGAAGIAVNGFAAARGGLTRILLLPVSPRELVRGTALGFALLAAPVALVNLATAGLFFRASSPFRWAGGLTGGAGSALLWLCFALVPAALLPRPADLSNDWQGSRPHEAAALASMVFGAVAIASPILLDRRAVAAGLGEPGRLALQLACLAVAAVGAALLLRAAERLVEARRENLALVAEGR